MQHQLDAVATIDLQHFDAAMQAAPVRLHAAHIHVHKFEELERHRVHLWEFTTFHATSHTTATLKRATHLAHGAADVWWCKRGTSYEAPNDTLDCTQTQRMNFSNHSSLTDCIDESIRSAQMPSVQALKLQH